MELLQIVLTVKSRYLFWKTDPNDKLVSGVTNPELHVCDIFVFVMPYPPRFRVFASSRDLKDLCYWCGRASGRRVIGSCSVIVRLLWNSREHYSGIQDWWWVNKYISWLFFKIQKCEPRPPEYFYLMVFDAKRGRCDPCQWSCRRCAYEDCIVIELNKPGSTCKKANPWRFVAERKKQKPSSGKYSSSWSCLAIEHFWQSVGSVGTILCSGSWLSLVGSKQFRPGNEPGILCGLNMSF